MFAVECFATFACVRSARLSKRWQPLDIDSKSLMVRAKPYLASSKLITYLLRSDVQELAPWNAPVIKDGRSTTDTEMSWNLSNRHCSTHMFPMSVPLFYNQLIAFSHQSQTRSRQPFISEQKEIARRASVYSTKQGNAPSALLGKGRLEERPMLAYISSKYSDWRTCLGSLPTHSPSICFCMRRGAARAAAVTRRSRNPGGGGGGLSRHEELN